MLNKKDIISINKEFETGELINESSLEYAINISKRTNSWIKQLAHLIRALLIDHAFKEGNKRTTATILATYLELNNYKYNPDEINKLIINILKNNITDINKIERMIENVIK
jgi:prophage maintenance system killer protein